MKSKKDLPIGWNPLSDHGTRYVDDLRAAGLRFVDWSDGALAYLKHKGWYADDEDGQVNGTYRGCVLRMAARDGTARFLAAYKESEDCNDGYVVDVSRGCIYEGRTDDEITEAIREAARAADGLAENYAEQEREYSEAWQAGSRYADLLSEARDATKAKRRLARDLRKAKRDAASAGMEIPATVCAALKASIADLTSQIKRATIQAKEILDEYRSPRLVAAFNDGAGR